MKELQDIRKAGPKYFRDVQVDEQNIFQWQGLLVPEAYPFNKGKLEKVHKIDIVESIYIISLLIFSCFNRYELKVQLKVNKLGETDSLISCVTTVNY